MSSATVADRIASVRRSPAADAPELDSSVQLGSAIAARATAAGNEGGLAYLRRFAPAQRHQAILDLQRTSGNAAVQRWLHDGSLSADPPSSLRTDVSRPITPAAEPPTPGAPIVQRSLFGSSLSDIEQVAKALRTQDPSDVRDIKDVNRATATEKLKLIRILAYQGWVGPKDEWKIEQIWKSFEDQLPAIASTEILLWNHCIKVGAELEKLPQVNALKDRFLADLKELVSGYLFQNRQVVIREMDRLGLPSGDKAVAPEPTAAQSDEIQKMQEAAAGVAKLQLAQESARGIYVGYQKEIDSTAPAGQPRVDYVPVTFNPFAKPEFGSLPSSLITYEVETKPYQDVKTKYDKATAAITDLLGRYPVLYAVSREGKSGATAGFAGTASPAQARQQLASAMQKLLHDIEATQKQLDGGKLDPLDLTPVHARLRGGTKAASGTNWSDALPNWVAQDLVKDHELADALTALGFEAASMALFALAPFTGGASLYVMLAGLAVTGAKATVSADHYETLAEAAKTSVTPGTELVTPEQVEHAKMIAEADQIALVLATLTVGATAAGDLIGRIRGPASVIHKEITIDWSKQVSSGGWKSSLVDRGKGYGVFEARIPGVEEPVVVKVYPAKHPVFEHDLKGAKAAARTGFGPKVYELEEGAAGPGTKAFAMEKVPGGFAEAVPNASQAMKDEAARVASKIGPQTFQDVETYSQQLLKGEHYYLGEVQGQVDDAGHWKSIDHQGIRELPPVSQAAERADAIKKHNVNIGHETSGLSKRADEVKLASTKK